MTYKLELTQERLQIHIKGLDASIRLIGGSLANSQNAPLALRNALPDLMQLNQELMELDKLVEEPKVEEKKDA